MNAVPSIILASSSPRRREILSRLGLEFQVRPPDVDEVQRPGERAEAFVERAAQEKAAAVASQLPEASSNQWILAADTMVVVDDEALGKPKNNAEARDMLRRLSGRHHRVLTGWALRTAERMGRSGVEQTIVWMKPFVEKEISDYVEKGESSDKAGAYGIQGLGCFLVDRIDGNYENVVGLPACAIVTALVATGAIPGFPLPTKRHPPNKEKS